MFRVVTGKTSRNPVAKAIARKKVHDRLLAAKMRIYLLEEGADDSAYLGGVMAMLTVVGRALEIEYTGKEDTMPTDVLRDTRVLRGGLSALVSCWTSWDPTQVVAVEQAIDAAERLNTVAKTNHIFAARAESGIAKE